MRASRYEKPNLLIPLPAGASRGDQILNARSFNKQGYSAVLEEENMTNEVLCQQLMICTIIGKNI